MSKMFNFAKKIFVMLAIYAVSTFGSMCQASGVPTQIVDGLIQNYIIRSNDELSLDTIQHISHSIIYYAYAYKVDPLLVTAMICTESRFNQSATSSVGAIGLTQLMPDTAEAVGVNPYNMDENIEGGCSYLATQMKNFSTAAYPVEYALAAYNAGPNAVKQYGGIPPYEETQNYVESIREKYFLLYDSLMYALA